MTHKASCLYGAVQVNIAGELPQSNACHCTACRKRSGHFEASVDAPRNVLNVAGAEHITWYQPSKKVRRGFCKTYGSSLFLDGVFQDWTAVSMRAFDTPTQTTLAMHIHVSEKGDYYDIADSLPQNQQ